MIWIKLALFIWIIAIALHIFGTLLSLHGLRKRQLRKKKFPPISILKPLKGVDAGLKENLETFFLLDYPEYELIFSIKDFHDPAIPLVREMIRKFGNLTTASLHIGDIPVGINPKVCNLMKSYTAAKYDLVLISDSNIRVRPNYLKSLVEQYDENTGVVTSVIAGKHAKGLGGHLESVYLNSFYARAMHITKFFGKPCVVGKCMLFQKSIAARFGGLKVLANYLAEDYMFGVAMKQIGKKVVVMNDSLTQYVGKYSVKDFWLRHLRWGRIRKAHAPAAFILEPLTMCTISGLIGSLSFFHLYNIPVHKTLTVHWLIWAICDFLVLSRVQQKVSLQVPLVWFIREWSSILLWIHTLLGNHVNWRGQTLRIEIGGGLHPVTEKDYILENSNESIN